MAAAATAAGSTASREVVCGEAGRWLEQQTMGTLCSVVTSLPDYSELITDPPLRAGASAEEQVAHYAAWVSSTVASVVGRLQPSAVALFYQTDVRPHHCFCVYQGIYEFPIQK